MTGEDLTARRYVFVDLAIIEIFNPDSEIWEYFVSTIDNADLVYAFGVENRFTREDLRTLWKTGYFETFKENA